ncbi:unnamed protein product [Effrenium voratum]|nr:unnamed protein product [Effrenium voratum]
MKRYVSSQALAPEYKLVALTSANAWAWDRAQHYAQDKDVAIVRLGMQKSTQWYKHPSAEIKSYPTLKLYAKGKKSAPIDGEFKTTRTKDGILDFIEQNRAEGGGPKGLRELEVIDSAGVALWSEVADFVHRDPRGDRDIWHQRTQKGPFKFAAHDQVQLLFGLAMHFAPPGRTGPGGERSCSSGCQRPAFAAYKTCCTHCKGPDGPHAADCAQKVELVGRRVNCPQLKGTASLVVRVVSAELFRSFDKFGRMDPFCQVDWHSTDGSVQNIGRTKSAWGQHMHPVWEHSCKSAQYLGAGTEDCVRFQVLEENFQGLGKPTFCGEAMVQVDHLVAGARMISPGLMQTQPQPVLLEKRGEKTGAVQVQILIYLPDGELESAVARKTTPVDKAQFQSPVHRLGVSGGTAPFFQLLLARPGARGETGDYWIGKDLSRAMDEVDFYENVKRLQQGCESADMQKLFGFMFNYLGVLETTEATDPQRLELLVLENLRHKRAGLRLLDIKVGEKTAAANWKGKSRLAALKQSLIDDHTNSTAEGFRLEGFDGQPEVLKSMDPLLDVGGAEGHKEKTQKKARRIMLQRLSAAEMLMHFLDLHFVPDAGGQKPASVAVSCGTELAEVVLSELSLQLVQLAVACREAQSPQKWIGSSVALGFDDKFRENSPAYREGCGFDAAMETALRKSVIVKIFDWGRSELNTLDKHSLLSAEDQRDRLDFWRLYVGGVERLAWEAARAYRHRFGNPLWSRVQLVVYDFDSMTDSDFIGQVTVDLAETKVTTRELLTADGRCVQGKEGISTLTFGISFLRYAESSRLKGAWSIQVIQANNLPACDHALWPGRASSDPFVKVFAVSEDESYRLCQRSTVKVKDLDPVWRMRPSSWRSPSPSSSPCRP